MLVHCVKTNSQRHPAIACALHHVKFMMMEAAIKIIAKLFYWFMCNITLSPLSKHVPFSILNTNQNMFSKGPVWFFFVRFSTDFQLFSSTDGSHTAFQYRTWKSRSFEPCNIQHLPLKCFRHWCFPDTISARELGWPSALSAQHDRCGFITWPFSASSCLRTFVSQSMRLHFCETG